MGTVEGWGLRDRRIVDFLVCGRIQNCASRGGNHGMVRSWEEQSLDRLAISMEGDKSNFVD